MLRIDRARQTLAAQITETLEAIETVSLAKGDYKAFEAGIAAPCETVSLPYYLNDGDARYFLHFECDVPRVSEGKELYIEVSTGREGQWDAVNPQLLAFIDGEVICGLDVNHRKIVFRKGHIGRRVMVGLHLYTGMQPGDCVVRLQLKCDDLAVRSAYYDLAVAQEALKALAPDSTAHETLYNALLEGAYLVKGNDVQAFSNWMATKVYGKTSLEAQYTVHAVGHTHIDVAWLWDLRQTAEKASRSYATALDLMSRYDNYRFMASQPILYEMVAASHPKLFETIVQKHKTGRWTSEGAMYLEADCNLISGESMVRQIELGKKYLREVMGVESKVLWLPDVFGYSAALPQILKGFGIELFVTSKISWNETNQMPYDSFLWAGIDGTCIPSQFITTMSMENLRQGSFKSIYEGNMTPSEALGAVKRHQQRAVQPHVLMPFGYGDGGGGATEKMLETSKRLEKGIVGMPKVVPSNLEQFVKAFQETPSSELPKWSGELYLEYHRGTYTTNGLIKQKHRQLENALIQAEMLQSLLNINGTAFTCERFEAQWRTLMVNQFHDILPGTSIEKVYTDAYAQLDAAKAFVDNWVAETLVETVAQGGRGVSFINVSGHTFDGTFSVPTSIGEIGEDGEIAAQSVGETLYLKPQSFRPGGVQTGSLRAVVTHKAFDPRCFETPMHRVEIDADGALLSLYDKTLNRELIAPGGRFNALKAYEDRPKQWDAWDINEDYTKYALAFDTFTKIEALSTGELVTVVAVEKRIGNSSITQHLVFHHDRPLVTFDHTVDWRETHVLMRTTFDCDILATEAHYDIQFGEVKRPVDQNNSFNAAMFEVCAMHYGKLADDAHAVMLLSDDKFGYSCAGGTLGLSLIKSPTWPNPVSDQGQHRYSYSLMTQAAPMNACDSARCVATCFNPPLCVPGTAVAMEGPEVADIFSVEAFRPLGDGVFELRLTARTTAKGSESVRFNRPFQSVVQTDLAGTEQALLAENSREVVIVYRPFELITLRVTF